MAWVGQDQFQLAVYGKPTADLRGTRRGTDGGPMEWIGVEFMFPARQNDVVFGVGGFAKNCVVTSRALALGGPIMGSPVDVSEGWDFAVVVPDGGVVFEF